MVFLFWLDDAEMESSILSKAERIRRYQEENNHLGTLVSCVLKFINTTSHFISELQSNPN